MGMGSAPAHGWILPTEELKKICPVEFEAFESALERHPDGHTIDSFAAEYQSGNDPSEDAAMIEIYACLGRLQGEFTINTKVNDSELTLNLGHYSRESGDRYDEMEDGHYWIVEGMEVFSPAGLWLAQSRCVEEKSWTIYG